MNFISPVEEIDGLWIDKMPSSKPVKVVRAVTVGRVTILQSERGRLYSPSAENVCWVPGGFDKHQDWFKALKALGVLTKGHLEKHKAACDARDERRSKGYAADSLARGAKDAGLPLTKAQQAFVEKYGRKRGAA